MRQDMTKTVVALYDDVSDAQTVSRELSAAGFTDNEVVDSSAISSDRSVSGGADVSDSSLAAGTPGVVGTPLGAAPETGTTSTTTSSWGSGGILSRLRSAGVPEDDSHMYAEGVRRGGSLVIARLADDNVDRGLEIKSNYRPVDIEVGGPLGRTYGWTCND
jgi:hypothetical protein